MSLGRKFTPLSIFFLLVVGISTSGYAANLMGPAPPPSTGSLDAAKAQCSDAKTDPCKASAQAIPAACQSQASPGNLQGSGANPVANSNANVQGSANQIAGAVAAACQAATTKCMTECKAAMNPSCPEWPARQMSPMPYIQAVNQAAKATMDYCQKEGQSRANAAKKQAGEHGESQKDSQENAKKNEDGGGGMPQMPQMPQGGGGDKSSPTPDIANTTAANPCETGRCPTDTAEITRLAGVGGEVPDTLSGLNDPSTPSEPYSPFYNPSPADSGGAAAAGGGGGFMPGGSSAKSEGPKKEDPPIRDFQMPTGGGEYGGSGISSGSSYSSSDEETKGGSGYRAPASARAAGMIKVQGLTGQGGRTNWQKVNIRYKDNLPTFLKDDAAFFKSTQPSRK